MSRGAYLLYISVINTITIPIGKLGEVLFPQGEYIYVGSAFNQKTPSNFLENRVIRHLKPPEYKKMHWHIDYLLANPNVRISNVVLIPSSQHDECDVAQEIKQNAQKEILHFGCSDCKCSSHLFLSK